jgi:membrane-associated phospholipid phosphatase
MPHPRPADDHLLTPQDPPTPRCGGWRQERALTALAMIALYALYFPATRYALQLTPIDMSTPLDRAIPLTPAWAPIYAMIYPAALSPLFVIRHPLLFRRVALAFALSVSVGLALFLITPVHMTLRPPAHTVTGDGFLEWGVRFCYTLDAPTGCFPSLHVCCATLAAIACGWANERAGQIMWITALLIDLSTLYMKQHFIADVISGTLLALTAAALAQHLSAPLTHPTLAHIPLGAPLRALLGPLALFALILGGLYALYLSRWI